MSTKSKQLNDAITRARGLAQTGQVIQAEVLYAQLLAENPHSLEVLSALASFAVTRGDRPRALSYLQQAHGVDPTNTELALDFAALLSAEGHTADAIGILEHLLLINPDKYYAWLLIGQLLDQQGRGHQALRAYYEAVTRAQSDGAWLDEETTPDRLLDSVVHAINEVRTRRKDILLGSYADLRAECAQGGLERVDRALSGYMKEWDARPADSRQKPKFFYFPGLTDKPFHDPYTQPWAEQLAHNYPVIREEALTVWGQDKKFQNFMELSERGRMEDYIRGDGAVPSWEAFFFYRHGKRFDANHSRCPRTSALLDSIELCRISDQAPEICFSVLKPGTHLLPHYGVTNVRLVMHLPLIVPDHCALNLVDAGEHKWEEGKLVMFDDTFQHEAWNRSDSTRIVLLMDCWNPDLTPVERRATKALIETITALQQADRAAQARHREVAQSEAQLPEK